MRRPLWAALLLAVACGSEGGPLVGTPGRDGGLELRYGSSSSQVVAVDEPGDVVLEVEVVSAASGGGLEPQSNLLLQAEREKGAAQLRSPAARTNAGGTARFTVRTRGEPDKSRFRVFIEGRPEVSLLFDVVSAPVVSLDLARSQIRDVPVLSDGAILRLPGAADGEYFFIPYKTDVERTGATYRIFHRGFGAVLNSLGGDDLSVPRTIAPAGQASGHIPRGSLSPGGLTASANLAPMVNIRSCRIPVDRKAPLRYLGQRIALYVDAPPDDYQARIDSLGRAFDESIFPLNTSIYGPTTDFDQNQRVIVVLSPELAGVGGVYCDTIRTIMVEAFYGGWSPSDAIDRPLSTLAHEHQHVINAGYHFATTGRVGDERWLNEGLSYAAEALHEYWGGAMVRMWQFLSGQNNGQSMLPLEYLPLFNDRYMMFALYLRDRFGPDLYRRLGTSGRRGAANVETVTGLSFAQLLRDWFVANAVSNRGLTSDPRFNYTSVDLHGMAGPAALCQCVPPGDFDGMNMERLSLGSLFDVSRTLSQADADYYRIVADEASPTGNYDVYFDPFGRNATGLFVVRNR